MYRMNIPVVRRITFNNLDLITSTTNSAPVGMNDRKSTMIILDSSFYELTKQTFTNTITRSLENNQIFIEMF